MVGYCCNIFLASVLAVNKILTVNFSFNAILSYVTQSYLIKFHQSICYFSNIFITLLHYINSVPVLFAQHLYQLQYDVIQENTT